MTKISQQGATPGRLVTDLVSHQTRDIDPITRAFGTRSGSTLPYAKQHLIILTVGAHKHLL
jgi:hypothetical protein